MDGRPADEPISAGGPGGSFWQGDIGRDARGRRVQDAWALSIRPAAYKQAIRLVGAKQRRTMSPAQKEALQKARLTSPCSRRHAAAPSPDVEANRYVDARVCAACHTNVYERYRHTGMAHAFYAPSAESFPNTRPYFHPLSGGRRRSRPRGASRVSAGSRHPHIRDRRNRRGDCRPSSLSRTRSCDCAPRMAEGGCGV
jgi:hypothetical protein